MTFQQFIVGAGPVGAYAALQNPTSIIIDQKKQIGQPVRCTGVLTDQIEHAVPKDILSKATLNTITTTKVHVGNKHISLPLGKNHIICNRTFEQELLNQARDKGCKTLLSHKYISSQGNQHHIRDVLTQKRHVLTSQHIIGADGPCSSVNKQFDIHSGLEKYQGYQIRLKIKEHDNAIQFYPTIGVYAWMVPESENIVRLGVCTRNDPQAVFADFRKQFKGVELDKQAGFIPLHKPGLRTVKRAKQVKAILLGDAAGHIKNTTGGGIIPGIQAAKTYSSNNQVYRGTPARLSFELYNHFLVHNLLNNCSLQEWQSLLQQSTRYAPIAQKYSRDELHKIAPFLISNTSLLSFGLKKLLQGRLSLW